MNIPDHFREDGKLVVSLAGRIDSLNSGAVGESIQALLAEAPTDMVILNLDELTYISSAGLRLIMRLRQNVEETCLINVHSSIYEILETTGFTEMMPVTKAYRVISIDGCEEIGKGANGKVYRIDRDTIVKVYENPDALPEIQRERELARTAFVLGVPTAIPYDTVRIKSGGYGSVFELLNANSYLDLLVKGIKTVEEIGQMSADLLKTIHSKVISADSIPDMKERALSWTAFLADYLPQETHHRLTELIEDIPEDHHLLHGDFYIKNIMYHDEESLLIDMDTLCHGHPVFELGSIYNAYIGFYEIEPENCPSFLGIKAEDAAELWRVTLSSYLGTDDEDVFRSVEQKARLLGHARLLRRNIRRGCLETEKGRVLIENSMRQINNLIEVVDSLKF